MRFTNSTDDFKALWELVTFRFFLFINWYTIFYIDVMIFLSQSCCSGDLIWKCIIVTIRFSFAVNSVRLFIKLSSFHDYISFNDNDQGYLTIYYEKQDHDKEKLHYYLKFVSATIQEFHMKKKLANYIFLKFRYFSLQLCTTEMHFVHLPFYQIKKTLLIHI